MRGEQLTFSVREDVYFLTGLPFRGMALLVNPQLPEGVHLADATQTYCTGLKIMLVLVVLIEVMDDLLHQCIVMIIVRIYRSLVMQQINEPSQNQ
jgi:hypothetical protein